MKLYIIGNGFDLNHGPKTSYCCFKTFLINLSIPIKEFEKANYLPNEIGDDWSNVENHLEIDYEDSFETTYNAFRPDLLNDESDSRWHNFTIEVAIRTELTKRIIGPLFHEWINSINENCNKKYSLDRNNLYVTFNYTHVLEKTYGLFPFHIHGKKNDVIQFGCFNNNPKEIRNELVNRYKDDDWYGATIEPAIDIIEEYCKGSFKDFERNKRELVKYLKDKNIDEVIVMGHSCLGIDECYYRDVFANYKCKWTIYCHSLSDYESAKQFEKKYGIKVNIKEW